MEAYGQALSEAGRSKLAEGAAREGSPGPEADIRPPLLYPRSCAMG